VSGEPWLGVALGLAAGGAWGCGDLCGGLAARRRSTFEVLAVAAVSGTVLLLVAGVIAGEPLPGSADAVWAIAAGLAGAVGIAALYRALAIGNVAVVVSTAAVLGASVPVLFGLLTEGLPGEAQLAGFALALAGIWLVNRRPGTGWGGAGLGLALLAGVALGGYLVLMAQIGPDSVMLSLGLARSMMLLVALGMLVAHRRRLGRGPGAPLAWLAGAFDAGGNVFYLLATQATRLDVAAVLASLSPAVTVVLAAVLLRHRFRAAQWSGLGICLGAVVLIAG
jgi:drug/metabolite transporter (DMT)-like permease